MELTNLSLHLSLLDINIDYYLFGLIIIILLILIILLVRKQLRKTSQQESLITANDIFNNEPTNQEIATSDIKPDLLIEANIYLEYGYYDRAAETLQKFVNESAQVDLSILHQLIEIYLQLEDLDKYAEVLEQLCLAHEQPTILQQILVTGLNINPHHHQLKLIDANYHISGESKNVDLVDNINDNNAVYKSTTEINSESQIKPVKNTDSAVNDLLNAALVTPPITINKKIKSTGETTPNKKTFPIVKGIYPLITLNEEEKFILREFASPDLEAKLYMATNEWEAAIPALQRAITIQPKNINHYIEILKLLYFKHDIEGYSRMLWKFYSAFGDFNSELTKKFISFGFFLGNHPILELLAQSRQPLQIEKIGKKFNLTLTDNARKKLSLITITQEVEHTVVSPINNAIINEVDAYLEYGQTDEALELLEKTILDDPYKVELYHYLLKLYDHMDAFERLVQFTLEIKKKVKEPPAEAANLIVKFYKRLNQRNKK